MKKYIWQKIPSRFVTFSHEQLLLTNVANKICHILSQITTLWHTLTQIVTKCQFSDLKLTHNKTHKNLAHRKILVTKNVTFEKFWCQKMSRMKNFIAIFIHVLSYKRVYFGTGIDQRLVKLVCWHFGHFFVFGQFR